MRSLRKGRESREPEKHSGMLTRLRKDTVGSTLAMMGMALIPIAAMIGAGLDISRAYMAHAKMQNACDAAALAARRTMVGNIFNNDVEREGERFFDFNFPENTMSAEDLDREITQSGSDASIVEVNASAEIPVTIMRIFGYDTIEIGVECDASQDYGNNDIMVVLDVTGSMNCPPGVSGSCGNVERSGSKGSRLRAGARGLYRALADVDNTRTRFGFMPYSMSVNVGADLRDRDILRQHYYISHNEDYRYYAYYLSVNTGEIRNWQNSGQACVDERGYRTSGNAFPIRIDTAVSRDEIDAIASNNNDFNRQWGRYLLDPQVSNNDVRGRNGSNRPGACPARATTLREYNSESSYNNAISAATSQLNGSTYHDIGLIWAARYLSTTGMFAASNPDRFNNVPVTKHIVYLTDGRLEPSSSGYSSYGVFQPEQRLNGSGSQLQRHIDRFQSACNTAKTMGMTIWVIALDEDDVDDIRGCATSSGHFFESDGSDLEQVFESIGAGIGRLRLSQ